MSHAYRVRGLNPVGDGRMLEPGEQHLDLLKPAAFGLIKMTQLRGQDDKSEEK